MNLSGVLAKMTFLSFLLNRCLQSERDIMPFQSIPKKNSKYGIKSSKRRSSVSHIIIEKYCLD
jgi:hypothetical protein